LNDQLAQQPRGKLWQRRLAMSAWEIIRDTFEEDIAARSCLYVPLAAEPPDAPMTGAWPTVQRVNNTLDGRSQGRFGSADAGAGAVIEAHNGVLLTNKWVKRLIVESGKCVAWNAATELRYRRKRQLSRRFTSSIWWTWRRASCGARISWTA